MANPFSKLIFIFTCWHNLSIWIFQVRFLSKWTPNNLCVSTDDCKVIHWTDRDTSISFESFLCGPIVIHTVLLGLIAMLFNVHDWSTMVKSCCKVGSMHFIDTSDECNVPSSAYISRLHFRGSNTRSFI